MRIALPIHEGQISPVFDWARRLLVVIADGAGAPGSRHGEYTKGQGEVEFELGDLPPALRARRLAELGVDTLLCGGISAPLAALVEAQGVEVIAGLVGEADAVLDAFLAGELTAPRFAMPGWRRPGQRTRARRLCGRGRGRGGGRGRGNRQ